MKNRIIIAVVFIVVLIGVITLFALNNEKKLEAANETEIVETVETVEEAPEVVEEAPVVETETANEVG